MFFLIHLVVASGNYILDRYLRPLDKLLDAGNFKGFIETAKADSFIVTELEKRGLGCLLYKPEIPRVIADSRFVYLFKSRKFRKIVKFLGERNVDCSPPRVVAKISRSAIIFTLIVAGIAYLVITNHYF